jgi:DNA polymerase I-like protein with 3'-5' exonuclease and polymerase domains
VFTIDFETHPIDRRSPYPQPVGVAIGWPDGNIGYEAWGSTRDGASEGFHDSKCALAKHMLEKIWTSGEPLLFHHAKFDLEVAEKWFGLSVPDWRRVHDTQFLAYLNDPHARSLGLKPLAAELLGMAPEERDLVAEWVVANKKRLKEIDPSEPPTEKNAGAWIWAAPVELVRPYAIGDVRRTRALFDYLMPVVEAAGMRQAYDRERELMPILLRNEQQGMRLDLERIEQDIVSYGTAFQGAENELRFGLMTPDLNFDADQDVAAVLLSRGLVREADMPKTDTGKWSMSKEELRPEMFQGEFGRQIAQALGYRNRLKTCLDTFMRPWAKQARANKGYITTTWNQVRSPGGGTRTGRPSTNNHNFLNIAKSFDTGRDDGYEHPEFMSLPRLPLCRTYILPDPGEVFIHRDYNGQELRIFAQGEQGELHAAYLKDPRIDPHDWVKDLMQSVAGRELARTPVKVLNFQSIYGGGAPALMGKLRCTLDEAKALKAAHDEALPGRKMLAEEMKKLAERGIPIRTLGGRLFYCERSGPDGRSKAYKLINYWVQGSAADLTKQALIDWHNQSTKFARFLVAVYDEINASVALEDEKREMMLLRDVMELPRFGMTVPMLTDGKRGPNWGTLEVSDANIQAQRRG